MASAAHKLGARPAGVHQILPGERGDVWVELELSHRERDQSPAHEPSASTDDEVAVQGERTWAQRDAELRAATRARAG